MGMSDLWILMSPLMVGAKAFILVYFHFISVRMRLGHWLMVFLICFCNRGVGL
jgi:hypothetical protein